MSVASKATPFAVCVFEIVTGVLHQAGDEDAPIVSMQANMASRFGPTWSNDILRLYALDFGLPQGRPRAYLVLHTIAYCG